MMESRIEDIVPIIVPIITAIVLVFISPVQESLYIRNCLVLQLSVVAKAKGFMDFTMAVTLHEIIKCCILSILTHIK